MGQKGKHRKKRLQVKTADSVCNDFSHAFVPNDGCVYALKIYFKAQLNFHKSHSGSFVKCIFLAFNPNHVWNKAPGSCVYRET